MRALDLQTLMHGIVQRCNQSLARTGSHIQLSFPLAVSRLDWHDRSLEKLLRHLTWMASKAADPENPVHIAVGQKKKMRGLETFLGIQPSHWIQLKIAQRGRAGFDEDARQLMSDLGYCCDEWIGAAGSWPQMGAYSIGRRRLLKFVLVIQWQRNMQQFEWLIPVARPQCLPDLRKSPIPSSFRDSALEKAGMCPGNPRRVGRTKRSKLPEARENAGRAGSIG